MIHGTGNDLILGDRGRSLKFDVEGVPQLEVLEYMIEL